MNQPVNWSPGVTLEQIEKQVILNAFRFYRGNKTQTAIALGIAIRTLENKLEKYEADGKLADERANAKRLSDHEQLMRSRGIVGRVTEATQSRQKDNAYAAYDGPDREPSREISAQHSVSVSERKEVQSVLPKHAAASGNNRRR